MAVRKGPSNQRSVAAEVEVPGTPEVVWSAIATGSGMSSWLVPSTSEERVGGLVRNDFGPGMESVGTIRKWSPPWRFILETEEGPGTIATEWSVEIRPRRRCGVRVVHQWVASSDAWDSQFEEYAYGWQAFFRILRLYLTHFVGQKNSGFQLRAFSTSSPLQTWSTLIKGLDIHDEKRQVTTAPGAPAFSGRVERRGSDTNPELLLRLERPAPGLAHLFVMPLADQVLVSVRFYLFGDQASEAARTTEREWSEWLAAQFPPQTNW